MAAYPPISVNEGSTAVISATFRDETGALVTPTSVKWSLFDSTGAVVNSRSEVVVTPASTVAIVLTGADLQLAGSGLVHVRRVVVIEATYNSTNGTGLTLTEQQTLDVVPLPGVP